jgi:hypothetical protein
MRSRERRRTVALCVAVGAVVAGCADPAGTAAPDQSAAPDVTGMPTSTDTADRPSARTSPGPTAQTTTADVTPVTVAVDGGDLPAVLVDGYATNGGDLVDPAEWRGRFGPAALPELTGPGVRLVEGLRRTELRDGNWIRTDEAGWLAMTGEDRDAMMRSLQVAADIDGVASRTESTDQGADCIIDTYPPDADGISWQLQGCSYAKFPRLLSLGISRTGPTDDPPTAIEPTIAAVADTIDGSVTFVEVRFGEPGADESTLRLSAHLSSQLGLDASADAVATGPLDGWQAFPGEDSVLMSGPTGATWTLSDGVAVFTWAGRW